MVYRKDLQVIRFIRYKLHPKSNYLTHLNLFMDETHNEYRFSHKVHERCDSGYIRFFLTEIIAVHCEIALHIIHYDYI